MNARTRRAGLVLAFVCFLSTPSCVTAQLWEPHCGRSHDNWKAAEYIGRILLTPFTLAIDFALLCAQCDCHR